MKKNCSRSVLFIVVLIFGLTKSLLAQTCQAEANQVAATKQSYVTTGILYNRVFPLAYLQVYKGISTDDTTSSDHFHQAHYELYHSMLNNSYSINDFSYSV